MEDLQRIARDDDAKPARKGSNAGTARHVPDMAGMPSSSPPSPFLPLAITLAHLDCVR